MNTRQAGFSLLELMVVLVIMALLFSFTTLTIQTDDPADQIREEAVRFDRLVELLLNEAILRGEDYGIAFDNRQYQFMRYTEGKWLPLEDRILRLREMPGEVEIEVALEATEIVLDNANDADEIKPQVFVLSSGEITPDFSASFFIPTITRRYTVSGRFDGQHSADVDE